MYDRIPRWAELLALAAGVLSLVFLAFGRSLWQGFAAIDDGFLIVGNLAIRGMTPATLKLAFTTYDPELYIPLTLVSFQINYLVSGLAPWSYHLLNLLLHAANAMLVMLLTASLLRANRASRANTYASRETETFLPCFPSLPYLPFFAALLFAVHPLHTEAVVWIAGRKDLLSTFFALLSLLAFLRYRDGSRMMYALSIIAFLIALLAKVSPATLPLIFLLSYFLTGRKSSLPSALLKLLPFVILSGIFLMVATGGKERILSESPLTDTILLAAKSTVFYLQKIFLPFGLSVFYQFRGTISLADPQFLLALFALFSFFALIAWSWRHHKMLAFGLCFFLLTLAPTFLNYNKGGGMYFAVDRYAYLPSIGILLLVAIAAAMVVDRFGARIVASIFLAITALFTFLSYRQTRVWNSGETLFGHAVALYPDSVVARTALANVLSEQKEYERAFLVLKEGLRYGDDPDLHIGAGNLYAATGDIANAEDQFRTASAMTPLNPVPIFSLGSLAEQRGNSATAQTMYEQAIALDPSYVGARIGLARLLVAQGDVPAARTQLTEALRWNPSSGEAQQLLESLPE